MEKIFLLMLIMGAFSPLINAYEYIVYKYTPYNRIRVFTDNNGILQIQQIDNNEVVSVGGTESQGFWNTISAVHRNQANYTSKMIFDSFYKNDLVFLNDLYTQSTQQFLNYLYNLNSFSLSNHVLYENYQILYDKNGFAVESIINDVWAGLYSDSEKGVSGRLYSSGGQLLYVNGKPINFIESQFIMLMDMVENSLRETVAVLGSLVPIIVAAVFVLLILYYVVSVGRRAIMPSNVKVRKRFLGSHNDEC